MLEIKLETYDADTHDELIAYIEAFYDFLVENDKEHLADTYTVSIANNDFDMSWDIEVDEDQFTFDDEDDEAFFSTFDKESIF